MSSDQELWAKAAEKYHQFVGSPQDKLRMGLLYPTIFEILGNIQGKSLLDIGCGNGLFAFEISKKGAQVSAFDSEAMVNIAQEHFSHPNIEFRTHDATKAFPYHDQKFDVVTANMVLMDMKNIETLLKESHRVLKDHGKAVFSILHPCFTPPVGRFRRGILGRVNKKYAYFHAKNYFSPFESTKDLLGKKTNYYHRTISDYMQNFQKHHFVMTDIFEPKPNEQWIKNNPDLYHADHIALFLLFVLQKTRY